MKKIIALIITITIIFTGCSYIQEDKKDIISDFEVHFIDVGQADAALIICNGETMLIDGGNVDDSSLIVSYLDKLDINTIDYMVATHAHEDHVGGLSGPLNTCKVNNVLCSVKKYSSKAFSNFKKYTEKQGLEIIVPQAGDSFKVGDSVVEVIGPRKKYDDTNETSIVLKVTYYQTSFLFTGDAGRESENDTIDAGCDLKADVLKVGHHGSETSTSYVFLREVMPKYAIISVGKNNSYGHPSEETLSRLRDAEVDVFRTDLQGDIICRSDGNNIEFEVEKNNDALTNPT